MTIKGVIFDVSDTLVEGKRGGVVPEILPVVQKLRDLGVKLIAVENDGPKSLVENLLSKRGLGFDLVVTKQEVGANKGSPKWVDYICNMLQLKPNELIYVGDSKFDMITASQSRIIYFHAKWGKPKEGDYGLDAPAPGYIAAIVEHIFLKTHNWWWKFGVYDQQKQPVKQVALINGYGAGDLALKAELVKVFKDDVQLTAGKMSLKEFVLLHLLASLYAHGLLGDPNLWWTNYPSRTPGKKSPMHDFLIIAAKLFREHYISDLFVRSKKAVHSREARSGGSDKVELLAALENQFTTVHLNPEYKSNLVNKKVLVFDDFITFGPTSEAARNLLLQAQVSDVVTVAIGKNGISMNTFTCSPEKSGWNPFSTLPDLTSINVIPMSYPRPNAYNDRALDEFLNSYRNISQAIW